LIEGMRATYGYTSSTLREAELTSGLAGIAVEYDVFGFPIYHGAADSRRVGGANGY
jgi:gamma-glutamyltranspeptidase / glutathione hydrolase